MGVPGFITWLETHSPEALVEMPMVESDTTPPREAEVVAFDLNSVVHNALRNARDEEQAIMIVFQKLHQALRQVRPLTTVVLALDGAAPLAKMETQRKRRAQSSKKDARKASAPGGRKGLSALCATPGTRFMAALENALIYWICSELQTYRARGLRFLLSGSDVPGEGELKIVDWLLSRGSSIRGEVVLIGGDGDLVLQALTLQQPGSLFVVREVPTKRRAGVGVHVPALRRRLSAARGVSSHCAVDDLEALACFSLMGNDYLPKLKEASFERLWRGLCALRRHPRLAGQRLLSAERAFHAPLLAALLEVVLRVHRVASAAVATDVEAGVAPSAARAAHAMDGLAPRELEATVAEVVAWLYGAAEEPGAFSMTRGGDGAAGAGAEAAGAGGATPRRALDFESSARYLGGVLWTVAMYVDGVASDYAFRFTNLNAPAASTLVAYLRASHPAADAAGSAALGARGAAPPPLVGATAPPRVPASAAAPLPAPLVCSALLPLGSLRALAAPALVAALEEGGSLAFLTAAERAAAAAADEDEEEEEAPKLPPLDYPRTLEAAAGLPEAVIGRSLRLSESPCWLDFTSTRANGRGRGRGRGGRGSDGRGRGGGRGGHVAKANKGLPELPALPPDPPSPKLRPLRGGDAISVQWLPASHKPRARRWADV